MVIDRKIDIKNISQKARRLLLTMTHKAGKGHVGGDLSEIDIICTLYSSILMKKTNKDRFILSKGHGAGGYYASLAALGLINENILTQFMGDDTLLPGHPVRQKLPGLIEVNTGGLGHGLPIGAGIALGNQLSNDPSRVFVLLGDGELEEGSNWEAAMMASKYKLNNLIAIVDRNKLQLAGRTEEIMPLESLSEKFTAFGWFVTECDGHDSQSIINAIDKENKELPKIIIAHTIKGKGVSFMENVPKWHHGAPTSEELAIALKELEG